MEVKIGQRERHKNERKIYRKAIELLDKKDLTANSLKSLTEIILLFHEQHKDTESETKINIIFGNDQQAS